MPRLAALLAIPLLLTACASSNTRQTRSEFEDISVPKGMTLDADKSTVIESPTVKAARLVYTGRIEPTSLASALRASIESSGWRMVTSTVSAGKGTTQVYEKGADSLQVMIYEGFWDTYLEIAGTRVLARPEAPERSQAKMQQPTFIAPLTPVPAPTR
jgi:hypothetical protein